MSKQLETKSIDEKESKRVRDNEDLMKSSIPKKKKAKTELTVSKALKSPPNDNDKNPKQKKGSIIDDINNTNRHYDDDIQRRETKRQATEDERLASEQLAKEIFYPVNDVITPQSNKIGQSSLQVDNLLTPIQPIQLTQIVSKETTQDNENDEGDGKAAASTRNETDNEKQNVNDDNVVVNDRKEIESKRRVGSRELQGLKFSKSYGDEDYQMLDDDPSVKDKCQRSTRKKIQENDKGVLHGKQLKRKHVRS